MTASPMRAMSALEQQSTAVRGNSSGIQNTSNGKPPMSQSNGCLSCCEVWTL